MKSKKKCFSVCILLAALGMLRGAGAAEPVVSIVILQGVDAPTLDDEFTQDHLANLCTRLRDAGGRRWVFLSDETPLQLRTAQAFMRFAGDGEHPEHGPVGDAGRVLDVFATRLTDEANHGGDAHLKRCYIGDGPGTSVGSPAIAVLMVKRTRTSESRLAFEWLVEAQRRFVDVSQDLEESAARLESAWGLGGLLATKEQRPSEALVTPVPNSFEARQFGHVYPHQRTTTAGEALAPAALSPSTDRARAEPWYVSLRGGVPGTAIALASVVPYLVADSMTDDLRSACKTVEGPSQCDFDRRRRSIERWDSAHQSMLLVGLALAAAGAIACSEIDLCVWPRQLWITTPQSSSLGRPSASPLAVGALAVGFNADF